MKFLIGLGLGLFIAEIVTWFIVAQFISGWWIFFATIMAFVVGLNMIRQSTMGLMPKGGGMPNMANLNPSAEMITGLTRALAGFFILMPGLLSDVIGLLLLIPGVQRWVKGQLLKTMAKKQEAMLGGMMKNMGLGGLGNGPQAQMFEEMMRNMSGGAKNPHDIIDGQARPVNDVKRINGKPANDA